MALDQTERAHVLRQIADRRCHICGGELIAHDDGVTPLAANGWGVSGAYVSCDDCGALVDPPEPA